MSTGDPRDEVDLPENPPESCRLPDHLRRDCCGACSAHDGCEDDQNPRKREDCQSCGACAGCVAECEKNRTEEPVGSTPVSEEPARDWGQWTPGKGLERLKAEMPGMVPELTAGDLAKADALIAAASKPDDAVGGATVNQKLTVVLPQLPDAEAAEWAARFREAMRHPSRFIVLPPDEDERERAAYARGISEGRRQATEGWERQWAFRTSAGITLPVSEEDALRYEAWNAQQRGLGLPAGEVLVRLVGPWEPAEQPEPDFTPFTEESLTIAEETFTAQAQALDPEVFGQESRGVWPRQGYLCAFGGADCPGHASKWLMCDPAAGGESSTRPRMTDGCGPEHTYRGSCEYAGETNRG